MVYESALLFRFELHVSVLCTMSGLRFICVFVQGFGQKETTQYVVSKLDCNLHLFP